MPAALNHITSQTPMGANLVADGATFRAWAPDALEVHVIGEFNGWVHNDDSLLTRDASGYWAGFFRGVLDRHPYKFFIVGRGGSRTHRDPYAREITSDEHNNCLVRNRSFPWRDQAWRTPQFHNLIIYQLHVGAFWAPQRPARIGTFLDVVGRLEYLADLGVTAIQLLPIDEFSTDFSKGYNGTDMFSPEMDYGVPDGRLGAYLPLVNRLLTQRGAATCDPAVLRGPMNQLKMLVNLCHLYGLAVLFDVVYNHAGGFDGDFGRQSLYFFDEQPRHSNNNSQYFLDAAHPAGGLYFAYWKEPVRQFLIDNAAYFLSDFHIDGLRYDLVNEITRHSEGWRFCQNLTATTRALHPERLDHAESWPVDPYVTKGAGDGGAGFDTQLHDGLRDTLWRVLDQASVPGEGPIDMGGVFNALRDRRFPFAWQSVQCVENHDELYRDRHPRTPRRADRSNARSWYARSRSRVALGVILTAPGIPMLFMGQEFLEDKPWADDARNHPGLSLYWAGLDGGDKSMVDFHRFTRDLMRLRHRQRALRGEGFRPTHCSNENHVLVFHRWLDGEGRDVLVVVSLCNSTYYGYEIGFPDHGYWVEVFNSDVYDHWVNPQVAGNGGGVNAFGRPMHDFPTSASITIPANSIIVFARDFGD